MNDKKGGDSIKNHSKSFAMVEQTDYGGSNSTNYKDAATEDNEAFDATIRKSRCNPVTRNFAPVSVETVDRPTASKREPQPTAQVTKPGLQKQKTASTWEQSRRTLDNRGITPVTVDMSQRNDSTMGDPIWTVTPRKLAQRGITPVVVSFEDEQTNNLLDTDDFLRGFQEGYEDEPHQDLDGKMRDPSFWDLTVNSASLGYNTAALGEEAWKAMLGQDNELDEYNAILASDKYNFEPDEWWEKAISGAAQQLGQLGRQITDPETLALVMGVGGVTLLAGQAGPQAAIPEEVITLPRTMTTAFKAGNAVTNMEIEGGLAYLEMLENGVSEETARAIAAGVGVINAGLEFSQVDELLKAYKVLNKSGADDSLLKIVVRELARRGVDVGIETTQEELQEITTIAGTQLGSMYDTGEWAYSFDDMTERLWDTLTGSALTFGLTNIPSGVHNTYVQNQNRLAAEGEARLLNKEMPSDLQLRAMGMSKPEALGKLVMLNLDQFDDAVDGNHIGDTVNQESGGDTTKKIGDFTNLEGSSVKEIISRIPVEAMSRKLYPVEGGSTEGVEYKWIYNGQTYRVRIHNADPGAPSGSNAASGWIVRIQRGRQYYDYTIDDFQPAKYTNPNGDFFSETVMNNTHIPILNPDDLE